MGVCLSHLRSPCHWYFRPEEAGGETGSEVERQCCRPDSWVWSGGGQWSLPTPSPLLIPTASRIFSGLQMTRRRNSHFKANCKTLLLTPLRSRDFQKRPVWEDSGQENEFKGNVMESTRWLKCAKKYEKLKVGGAKRSLCACICSPHWLTYSLMGLLEEIVASSA